MRQALIVLGLMVGLAGSAYAQLTPPNPSCPIKGNIGEKGDKVYHLPGDSWYGRTKIDTAKGERWFCSEAEAQKAGWRAPKSTK